MSRDPYLVLGVERGASSEELHDAYRRLVKLHHPDHNGGSEVSARRFEEIQEAYDRARELRAGRPPRPATPPPGDAAVESRMADLERELREAQAARDKARRAARDAVRDASGRPSDEQLGYVTTDDSFTKILADVRAEVSDKLAGTREHPAVRRVADMIDGLDEIASRFGPR